MEDSLAITMLKEGDLAGLEVLVDRYYLQAVRSACLIVQDLPLAEDIVQEAFIRAAGKISQLRSNQFVPWFLKSVVNASLREVKKQQRHTSLPDQDDEVTYTLSKWLIDQSSIPEAAVETVEFRNSIWQALNILSPDQRAAIVMKYYLDMSEKEIITVLRLPLSTIKKRLFSARQNLNRILTKNLPSIIPNPMHIVYNHKRKQQKRITIK